MSTELRFLPGHNILVEYAMSLFKGSFAYPGITSVVHGILDRFICRVVTREQCILELAPLIFDTAPIDQVTEILNISEKPIGNSSGIDSPNAAEQDHKKVHAWTPKEDTRLIAGIHRYGAENWSAIARFVGNNRTRSQCSQRWLRGLDPRISKLQWDNYEDQLLMRLVSFFGDKSWTQVASKMGHRSDVQCRYRYHQLMKKHGYQPPLSVCKPNPHVIPIAMSLPSRGITSPSSANPPLQTFSQYTPMSYILPQHIRQQSSTGALPNYICKPPPVIKANLTPTLSIEDFQIRQNEMATRPMAKTMTVPQEEKSQSSTDWFPFHDEDGRGDDDEDIFTLRDVKNSAMEWYS